MILSAIPFYDGEWPEGTDQELHDLVSVTLVHCWVQLQPHLPPAEPVVLVVGSRVGFRRPRCYLRRGNLSKPNDFSLGQQLGFNRNVG
jgi:hypothetical protein